MLTNFSDNFDRANGSLGTNYTKAAGSDYIITNNTVLRTGGGTTDLTYLNAGKLFSMSPSAPFFAWATMVSNCRKLPRASIRPKTFFPTWDSDTASAT